MVPRTVVDRLVKYIHPFEEQSFFVIRAYYYSRGQSIFCMDI